MIDGYERFDLDYIYKDISEEKSEQYASKCLAIILYLKNNNIKIEDYLHTHESCILKLSLNNYNCEDFNKTKQFNMASTVLSYPDRYIQGYIACYLYLKIRNDRESLYEYIKSSFQSYSKNKNVFWIILSGVILFFQKHFDINELHHFLYIVTTRSFESDRSTRYLDIISIILLLISGKKSIWEINQNDLNKILKFLQPLKKRKGISQIRVNELLNCKSSDVIYWWKAIYLGNESKKQNHNTFAAPPKDNINFDSLFKENNVEDKLKFALGTIKNKSKMGKQIKDVYNRNYMEESYHGLVQKKIREFVHYYNFCIDNKIKPEQSESIKTYIDKKCYGHSNNYKNRLINALRGYFYAAMSLGYYSKLNSNPVKYYFNVRGSKFAKLPDRKVIPPNDIQKLLKAGEQLSKFENLFIKLMYYTGLRIGEALNLTVGCVVEITDNAVAILVPPFKSRKHSYIILIEEKEILSVIKELIAMRGSFGRVPHYKTGEPGLYLLTQYSDDGRGIKHLNPAIGNRIIKKACKLAGIDDYTNHCFRHTFAHRYLYEKKCDPDDLSTLLGQECPDTLQIYTHLTNEEKLIFFSRYLNRKDATENIKLQQNLINITLKSGRKVNIKITDGINRWNGNGFCSHTEKVICPKRFVVCYPCPIYNSCKEKSQDIVDDFFVYLKYLDNELRKTYPIYKEVMFFQNTLFAIIKHLKHLDIPTEQMLIQGQDILQKSAIFLKEMKY